MVDYSIKNAYVIFFVLLEVLYELFLSYGLSNCNTFFGKYKFIVVKTGQEVVYFGGFSKFVVHILLVS